jgi:lipopolysaccharide/colanic/teichoic acid biosynthesis glycosyltransferase
MIFDDLRQTISNAGYRHYSYLSLAVINFFYNFVDVYTENESVIPKKYRDPKARRKNIRRAFFRLSKSEQSAFLQFVIVFSNVINQMMGTVANNEVLRIARRSFLEDVRMCIEEMIEYKEIFFLKRWFLTLIFFRRAPPTNIWLKGAQQLLDKELGPKVNDTAWIYSESELTSEQRLKLQRQAEDNVKLAKQEGRVIDILGDDSRSIEEKARAYTDKKKGLIIDYDLLVIILPKLKERLLDCLDKVEPLPKDRLSQAKHRIVLGEQGEQLFLAQTGVVGKDDFAGVVSFGSYEEGERVVNHSLDLLNGLDKRGPPGWCALVEILRHEDRDLEAGSHQTEPVEVTRKIDGQIKIILDTLRNPSCRQHDPKDFDQLFQPRWLLDSDTDTAILNILRTIRTEGKYTPNDDCKEVARYFSAFQILSREVTGEHIRNSFVFDTSVNLLGKFAELLRCVGEFISSFSEDRGCVFLGYSLTPSKTEVQIVIRYDGEESLDSGLSARIGAAFEGESNLLVLVETPEYRQGIRHKGSFSSISYAAKKGKDTLIIIEFDIEGDFNEDNDGEDNDGDNDGGFDLGPSGLSASSRAPLALPVTSPIPLVEITPLVATSVCFTSGAVCLDGSNNFSNFESLLVPMLLGAVLLAGLLAFFYYRSHAPPQKKVRTINTRLLRLLDIVFILVFSPLLIILALFTALIIHYYIKTNGSKVPVIYRRTRIGYKGEEFMIYKFSTIISRDPTKPIVLLRVRFLGMDEIPQAINILKGQMSVWGPRPMRKDNLKSHPNLGGHYLKMMDLRKNGWLSLFVAYRGAGRGLYSSSRVWDKFFKMNQFELDNWSIRLAIVILIKNIISLMGSFLEIVFYPQRIRNIKATISFQEQASLLQDRSESSEMVGGWEIGWLLFLLLPIIAGVFSKNGNQPLCDRNSTWIPNKPIDAKKYIKEVLYWARLIFQKTWFDSRRDNKVLRADLYEARGFYEEALELEPDNIEALKALIEIAFRLGDRVEELRLATVTSKLYPLDVSVLNRLVKINIDSGNYYAAIMFGERIEQLRPGDISNKKRLKRLYGKPGVSRRSNLPQRVRKIRKRNRASEEKQSHSKNKTDLSADGDDMLTRDIVDDNIARAQSLACNENYTVVDFSREDQFMKSFFRSRESYGRITDRLGRMTIMVHVLADLTHTGYWQVYEPYPSRLDIYIDEKVWASRSGKAKAIHEIAAAITATYPGPYSKEIRPTSHETNEEIEEDYKVWSDYIREAKHIAEPLCCLWNQQQRRYEPIRPLHWFSLSARQEVLGIKKGIEDLTAKPDKRQKQVRKKLQAKKRAARKKTYNSRDVAAIATYLIVYGYSAGVAEDMFRCLLDPRNGELRKCLDGQRYTLGGFFDEKAVRRYVQSLCGKGALKITGGVGGSINAAGDISKFAPKVAVAILEELGRPIPKRKIVLKGGYDPKSATSCAAYVLKRGIDSKLWRDMCMALKAFQDEPWAEPVIRKMGADIQRFGRQAPGAMSGIAREVATAILREKDESLLCALVTEKKSRAQVALAEVDKAQPDDAVQVCDEAGSNPQRILEKAQQLLEAVQPQSADIVKAIVDEIDQSLASLSVESEALRGLLDEIRDELVHIFIERVLEHAQADSEGKDPEVDQWLSDILEMILTFGGFDDLAEVIQGAIHDRSKTEAQLIAEQMLRNHDYADYCNPQGSYKKFVRFLEAVADGAAYEGDIGKIARGAIELARHGLDKEEAEFLTSVSELAESMLEDEQE